MKATVLIVEDEKNTREGLSKVLEEKYDVYEAVNADEAFRLMDAQEFDVVLTDLKMAGKSGLSVIDKAVTLPNHPICIMMTAYGNIETAVEAMKRGAYDFLPKPVNIEKLEILIQRALKSKKLESENKVLHSYIQEKSNVKGIIGHTKVLQEALKEVAQVAPSKASVLLYGETGTGKELFAQLIHQQSSRASEPFIAVHCAALAPTLLESELFGFEKGAFTGATERRMGRFEAADHGTLFLDEIGDIDAQTQVKLLRFLESKTFERLGSIKPIKVDVRLICATNRDLAEMVKKGQFREDLYYRLNVVTIQLPTLRERKEDIPLLLEHYIEDFSKENGLKPFKLSPEVIKVLENYEWPGNIRELRNFCENIVVRRRGANIAPTDLDPKFFAKVMEVREDVDIERQTVGPQSFSREENEKALIQNALMKAGYNKTKAAELMGISRRTLHRKLEKWPELG